MIVGREWKHGLMASSKTDDRLVRRRISDLPSWMGIKNCDNRMQPWRLKGRLSSSIMVRMGGTRSEKCASKRSRSVDWVHISSLNNFNIGNTYFILIDNPGIDSGDVDIIRLPRLSLRVQNTHIEPRQRNRVEVLSTRFSDGRVFSFCKKRSDPGFE